MTVHPNAGVGRNSCENCRWSVEVEDFLFECHRHPPRVIGEIAAMIAQFEAAKNGDDAPNYRHVRDSVCDATQWPSVTEEDFCGEWMPRFIEPEATS